MEDLRKAVGFRRVIDEISESGKPVITHNGLLVCARNPSHHFFHRIASVRSCGRLECAARN